MFDSLVETPENMFATNTKAYDRIKYCDDKIYLEKENIKYSYLI